LNVYHRNAIRRWPLLTLLCALTAACGGPAQPQRPDSATVPLGDVGLLAKGGGLPDTAVCFSPNGKRLAVGTFLGRIMLLDVATGRPGWDKQVAEGIVKRIAFSNDGAVVYFGEQSVDGFVYAADAHSGEVRWRFRLADDLKTSAPPATGSLYDVYKLPGCYHLKVLDDGDLLVLGVHSWGDYNAAEQMLRLSRLYRLSPEGRVRWAFPADGPATVTLLHFDADGPGRRVVVASGRKAGNTPNDAPIGPESLYVLDGATGRKIGQHTFEPLRPHFREVLVWRSVSVDPAGRRAVVGLYDGRTFLFDLDTAEPARVLRLGEPVVISGVPVSARATFTRIAADGALYFQTGPSRVPFVGGGQRVVGPPGPHPWANTIHAADLDGNVQWRLRTGHQFHELAVSGDGRYLAVCAERDDADGHESGLMLLDTHRPGGGASKLAEFYPVAGATFLQAAIAPDGRHAALVEVPRKDSHTGILQGAYRVHVLRRDAGDVQQGAKTP